MKKVVVLIAAAGKGRRMGAAVNKQFLFLYGKPILYYTLTAFELCQKVSDIYLILAPEDIDHCKREVLSKYKFNKITKIIEGGKERQDSIYNAINKIDGADKVLIHDGARPLITVALIDQVIDQLDQEQAVILGVPSKDTIKSLDHSNYIKETLDRKELCLVQTPQGFDYNLIVSAYKQAYKSGYYVTDDAALIEKVGGKIKVLLGSHENIKITTPEDLIIAEAILKKRIKE